MKYTVKLEEQPKSEDVVTIRKGLDNFNRPYAGDDDYKELTILLRDDEDSIVGGLHGGTYWGYLYIDVLWIGKSHRRRDQGRELLKAVEEEAIKRSCRYAHLNTHSFQALSFYEKHGYRIVGELEDLPPGYSRFLLRKVL